MLYSTGVQYNNASIDLLYIGLARAQKDQMFT